MHDWLSDLRRSARSLVREPGFTLPALACLTLTIGAATAVFAVLDATLLRPLPFPEPGAVRSLYAEIEQAGDFPYSLSRAKVDLLAEQGTVFESIAAWRPTAVTLTGRGEPRQLDAAYVEPQFFRTLRIEPLIGGDFANVAAAGERAAYLSERLWLQDFGGTVDILGSRIVVDDEPATVLGVVADRQVLPADTDLWLPLDLAALTPERLHSGNLGVYARLDAGVGDARLAPQLEAIGGAIRGRYPEQYAGHSLHAQSLRRAILGDSRSLLLLLLAAAGLLLVLGSANVATLVLVRNRRLRRSVATRAALGGSRHRIVNALLAEMLLLGCAGALAGAAMAAFVAPHLLRLAEVVGPVMSARILDARTFGFVALTTLVTSLGVGLLPALSATRQDLASVLRNGRGAGSGEAGTRRAHALLIAGQAALGLLLVVAAQQTIGEMRRLGRPDGGFAIEGVTTLRIHVPTTRYPASADYRRLFDELRQALAAVPGVEAVGAVSALPVGDGGSGFSFSVEDRPPADPDQTEVEQGRLIVPGYFEALGIRLLAGRPVAETDREDSPPVVVVSQALAERYWPGESAIGKRLKRRTYGSAFPWREVVGVVDDVRHDNPGGATLPMLYFPHAQVDTSIGRRASFVVRSPLPSTELLPALRARLAEIDPRLPIARVATLGELLRDSLATRRLGSTMIGVFALIGVILLATGTYGVVAFAVAQRRRELALRLALGADPRSMVGLVVGENLRSLAGGTAVGLLLSLGVGRLVADALIPATVLQYGLALALTLAIGLVASLQPVRRALALDPASTLRGQGTTGVPRR